MYIDKKDIVKTDRELKKCPFCKGDAVVVATSSYGFDVVCTKCGAKMPSPESTCLVGYDKALAETIDNWNKRV